MTCREVTEFLLDYVAGELPTQVLTEFERHLARCAACREFLTQYRATIGASRAACAAETDPPPALPDDLLKAILDTLARTP